MSDRPLLYHMPQTRAGTVLFMDEELGGVLDVKLMNLRAGEGRKADFLSINPMGKVPTLTHGGVTVTEAGAICAYLADRFPAAGLAPAPDSPARGTYYRWMFFAPSCIEPAMMDKFAGRVLENPGSAGHGDFQRVSQSIEAALAGGPWLLGDHFSAADVAFGSTLNFGVMFGAFEKKGAIGDYLDRLTARPAYERAQARNATYLKEMGL